ncbi:MAG: hypothetical protein V4706_14745 [Pseudomonadota bacterium]
MKTQILAVLTAALSTIGDIEKEVRDRCHETTSQKLQAQASAIEGAIADLSKGDIPEYVEGGPDPMALIMERVMASFEKSDALADERARLQADTVKVLEALVQGLGLADTPPAG